MEIDVGGDGSVVAKAREVDEVSGVKARRSIGGRLVRGEREYSKVEEDEQREKRKGEEEKKRSEE